MVYAEIRKEKGHKSQQKTSKYVVTLFYSSVSLLMYPRSKKRRTKIVLFSNLLSGFRTF